MSPSKMQATPLLSVLRNLIHLQAGVRGHAADADVVTLRTRDLGIAHCI